MKRRAFLKGMAGCALAGIPSVQADTLPPIRTLTRGPKFHWFGYYDKLEFDPSGRYVLGNQVDFQHRSPTADDVIKVGMVDLEDGDRWIELGESRAWNWQQGCMLQWLPGSNSEVIWNDRQGDLLISYVMDVHTRKRRILPHPVYCISPDGTWALTTDFRRLNDCRPGYGYAGIPDPNRDVNIPEDIGIWKMNLENGRRDLVVSLAQAAKIPYPPGFSNNAKHWFNHLLVAPDGRRIVFLHRWRGDQEGKSFATRMLTSSAHGKDMYVLDPHGKTSHFIWRDPRHVAAWAWHPSRENRFYLYEDQTDRVEPIGPDVMTRNGHITYLPGNEWILNDAYPDKERLQHVYLYHVASEKKQPLGAFHLPPEYKGEWRCDTHPRFSPDGTKVVIDSPHTGQGRQLHLIDISGIVRKDI